MVLAAGLPLTDANDATGSEAAGVDETAATGLVENWLVNRLG
jgi:hypothetical protein